MAGWRRPGPAARLGGVIEILTLRALACAGQGDRSGALAALERALALAEPEGYVRVFVDEGAPMAALLRQAPAGSARPAYRARLLAAFPGAEPRRPPTGGRPSARRPRRAAQPRERAVLRLLVAGLPGPDDRPRTVRQPEHDQEPPEEPLRQAGRPQPRPRPSPAPGSCDCRRPSAVGAPNEPAAFSTRGA